MQNVLKWNIATLLLFDGKLLL